MHGYIRCFSHFLCPGVKQIGYGKCSDMLDVIDVRNPDGSYEVVLLKWSEEDQGCYLRVEGRCRMVPEKAETGRNRRMQPKVAA